MALSLSNSFRSAAGDTFTVWSVITGDTSYPSGGYPLTASQFTGIMNTIFAVDAQVGLNSSGGTAFFARYDPTTKKLQFFLPTGAEVTGGTNVSTYSLVAMVLGR